jgi:hypothetical protein
MVDCRLGARCFGIVANGEVENFARRDGSSTVMCKETDYSIVTNGTFILTKTKI